MAVDNDISHLSSRVQLFLLGALREKTIENYTEALRAFKIELRDSEFDWRGSSLDARDAWLADFFVSQREDGGGRQKCVMLLAALRKVCPSERYAATGAVLQVWSSLQPPRQAPACPSSLAWAIGVLAVSSGQPAVGMIVVLCFEGVLRVSEPLRLRFRDIHVSQGALILVLSETKRGIEQRVVIKNPTVRKWMTHYLARCDSNAEPDDFLFGISYGRVLYWVRKISTLLGFAELRLTSHSFRRGGASHLLDQGWPIADIMQFGRWASMSSAQEYLRIGSVYMLRCSKLFSPSCWERVSRLQSLTHLAWVACPKA